MSRPLRRRPANYGVATAGSDQVTTKYAALPTDSRATLSHCLSRGCVEFELAVVEHCDL